MGDPRGKHMARQDVNPEHLAHAWAEGYSQALKEPIWDHYWDRPWEETHERTPNPYGEAAA